MTTNIGHLPEGFALVMNDVLFIDGSKTPCLATADKDAVYIRSLAGEFLVKLLKEDLAKLSALIKLSRGESQVSRPVHRSMNTVTRFPPEEGGGDGEESKGVLVVTPHGNLWVDKEDLSTEGGG